MLRGGSAAESTGEAALPTSDTTELTIEMGAEAAEVTTLSTLLKALAPSPTAELTALRTGSRGESSS